MAARAPDQAEPRAIRRSSGAARGPGRAALGAAALLAAAASLAGAVPSAAREKGPRGGEALAEPPAATGLTGGVTVLRAPMSAEVLIRGGEFQMGSTLSEVQEALALCRRESSPAVCDQPLEHELSVFRQELQLQELLQNELVVHPVSLSPYWIDRREVTVESYRRCAVVGACAMPPLGAGGSRHDRSALPVSLVSWDEARAYCQWRGARLPTEAEWERAARGPRGRRFPWGNEYNRRTQNHGALVSGLVGTSREAVRVLRLELDGRDGFAELAPVGSFPDGRTAEGIDDLAGNVAEWVSDYYEPRYDAVSAHDPKGPAVSTNPRVVRGGGFRHGAPWMRGASRLMAFAGERYPWLGFRCARDGLAGRRRGRAGSARAGGD